MSKRPTNLNVLFCINEGPDKISLYSSQAGTFSPIGTFTEDIAIWKLAQYSRVLALFRQFDDAFSGLYLPCNESKDIREAAYQQYYQEARLEVDIE
jgi:hypothetical protein